MRRTLSQVPPKFSAPKLSRIKARPDLHPKQAAVIGHLRSHPRDSYLILGRNGSGKTHLAWALFRNAVVEGRGTVACLLADLIADFRRLEMAHGDQVVVPRITVEQLQRPGARWFLFLDEFEKARPSEFAAETLFRVLDAARAHHHQLVATSNQPWQKLREHWGRVDPVWGNSIVERLKDCFTVNLF